jgi:Ca-activated chloride channel family protein
VISGPGAAAESARDSTAVYGYGDQAAFEEDKLQRVEGVRQVGNQAVFRRGKVWVANSAADVDLAKVADQIKTVERYSEEYFELVHKNTTEENQVLATQKADEELVIKLRGQLYRIK